VTFRRQYVDSVRYDIIPGYPHYLAVSKVESELSS
jgi:hypothetical protein